MAWDKAENNKMLSLIKRAKVTKDLAWYKKVILPKILNGKSKYKKVAEELGIPVVMLPLLQTREKASDLGVFKSYLGNGQPLSKVTTIVPRGRGPFFSWEEGAIDALKLRKLHRISDWTEARMFYEIEGYNGFGYRNRGINSPYVWNGTNLYSKGAYVSDGKFSADVVDGNIGTFALYKMIVEADSDFALKENTTEEKSSTGSFAAFIAAIVKLITDFFNKTEKKTLPGGEPTRNELVLRKAASQIGVREVKGSGSNKVVEEYLDFGSRVDNKDSGHSDSVPWCAGFVAWCLEKVGMGSTNSLMARSYENWGVSSKHVPLPGDIVTFYRNGKESGSGHVGFLVKKEGSVLHVLGGNQNDEVNVSVYTTGRMTDIRRSSKAGSYSDAEVNLLFDIAEDILKGVAIKEGGKVT